MLQHLEVEDGLLDGDRDELLGLEHQRGTEVLLGHLRQVGLAGDDALVAGARDHLAGTESRLSPQATDGRRHGRRVDDLAAAHHPGRKGHLAEAGHADLVAAEDELHGPDGARPDVESDGPLRHQASPPGAVQATSRLR